MIFFTEIKGSQNVLVSKWGKRIGVIKRRFADKPGKKAGWQFVPDKVEQETFDMLAACKARLKTDHEK